LLQFTQNLTAFNLRENRILLLKGREMDFRMMLNLITLSPGEIRSKYLELLRKM
jgi:hypothetical protein